MTGSWRSTTCPPSVRYAEWPSAAATICSPAQTLAANVPLQSTASLAPQNSTALNLRRTCASCSHASPTTRSTASTNSHRGSSPISSAPQSDDHDLQSRRCWCHAYCKREFGPDETIAICELGRSIHTESSVRLKHHASSWCPEVQTLVAR
jgi:hypothetical protein